jgi:thiol-disulfide isomerase/thioredoxin
MKGRPTAFLSGRTWLRKATGWAPLLLMAGLIIAGAVVGGAILHSRSASLAPLPASSIARATDFQLSVYQGEDLLGGEEVKVSELLAQGKPVVLNMWTGLCPPCRVEMPDLQEVSEEYQGRVLLVGLDVGPFVGLGSRGDGRALL